MILSFKKIENNKWLISLARRRYAQIWGTKISRFPGPYPLPLAQEMDIHASKTLCTGLYKS
jgi:hypothetical protein